MVIEENIIEIAHFIKEIMHLINFGLIAVSFSLGMLFGVIMCILFGKTKSKNKNNEIKK